MSSPPRYVPGRFHQLVVEIRARSAILSIPIRVQLSDDIGPVAQSGLYKKLGGDPNLIRGASLEGRRPRFLNDRPKAYQQTFQES